MLKSAFFETTAVSGVRRVVVPLFYMVPLGTLSLLVVTDKVGVGRGALALQVRFQTRAIEMDRQTDISDSAQTDVRNHRYATFEPLWFLILRRIYSAFGVAFEAQ